MAYQLKYFLEYKSLKVGSTNTYRLELWQNTEDVLVAEEIKGGQSPFLLEMPELSHKFQVIRGRGCTINLLSNTDMKFFYGLKHIDPKEFKYIHKVDEVVNAIGYLNSDMYSEPYDFSENYIISTTGNDGFSLMDRYRFLQSDETKYVGLKSEWELLQICLSKIGLEYNDIKISLSTTIPDYVIGSEDTILHISYVNCSNFYDEDDLPMTLRQVIESILAPYGAFICQNNGSIYITDVHTLAGGGSITFNKYHSTTYAFVESVIELVEKDVYDVGYFGTGHSITRDGGTNLQRVVYSPYPEKVLIRESIVNPGEFATVPESFSEKDGYSYRTLVGHNIWQNVPMTQSTFEESYYLLGERSIYFRTPQSSANVSVLQLISNTVYLVVKGATYDIPYWDGFKIRHRYKDGAAILITGDLLVKTKNNPYDESESGVETTRHSINYKISIGNLYYNSDTNEWTSTPYVNNYLVTTNNAESISDKWVGLGLNGKGLLIEIGGTETDIFSGELDFEILSNTTIQPMGGTPLANNAILKETWIKNLKIAMTNIDGSEIEDSDIEYLGHLDKLFAQEGETINLTLGTQSLFADRGKILKIEGSEYSDILEWTRAGQTYKIEELLLNSLCSNYRVNFVTLGAMKLKNEFSILSLFTDTTFLEENPKMMIKSSVIDFANYTHEVTLVEISEDELTIVKE